MTELIYKEEFYKIIGICMEVHRLLGRGFLEIIYKDALEYECKKNNIPFQREKEYKIPYKEIILQHMYYADFVLFDKIILEVKAINGIIDEFIKQTLNYLSASNNKLGIIVNFGEDSLKYKRLVL
ncbi:MAG: GxxExxY protein [Bacteroidetes bacterium]|nr:GxxExxY protein [Bacteroidota bacterium]MCH7771351.1 GxxExxY protein [Bacteroidota bacterium]